MPYVPSDSEEEDKFEEPIFVEEQPRSTKRRSTARVTQPVDVDEDMDEDMEQPAEEDNEPVEIVDVDALDDAEENEDEEEEEPEYEIEMIKSHLLDDAGVIRFQVKWVGFDKVKDMTYEPEEHFTSEGAKAVLKEYYEKMGGRDKIFGATKTAAARKGAASKRARSETEPPAAKKKRKADTPSKSSTPDPKTTSAKADEWTVPTGSWEDLIHGIDAVDKGTNGEFIIYVLWRNGRRTQHPREVVYRRCPQQMLRFYDRHLYIIPQSSTAETSTDVVLGNSARNPLPTMKHTITSVEEGAAAVAEGEDDARSGSAAGSESRSNGKGKGKQKARAEATRKQTRR